MQAIQVDTLTFEFPDDWTISKYDEWSFYKNQFSKVKDGIQAVDLIAIAPDKTVWLIEAKDFRQHTRRKSTPIHTEIFDKVYDTLAALIPTKHLATVAEEQTIAQQVLQGKQIRVVFHCEQPFKPSKLFPTSVDVADVQQKMKRLFRAIDPHVMIVSKRKMPTNLSWKVQ